LVFDKAPFINISGNICNNALQIYYPCPGASFGSDWKFHVSAGKWFLSWNMMVGRLEMFSALVVLYPSFWKK